MTNQLYHLIPEPAGDWQEGDRHVYLPDANYRLRPVKAQAGQLWRVEWDEDIYKVTDGIEVIGMGLSSIKANRLCDLLNRPVPAQAGPLWRDLLSELLTWQGEIIPVLNDEVFRASHVRKLVREVLSVQAQACACEGLRAELEDIAANSSATYGRNVARAALWKYGSSLAQSCPCQQDASEIARIQAHRACHSAEHDPANGKIHGYCVVCGVPFPCAYVGEPPCQQSGEQPENEDQADAEYIEAARHEGGPFKPLHAVLEEISEKGGDATCSTSAQSTAGMQKGSHVLNVSEHQTRTSSAAPESNPPAAASEAQAGLQSILDKCWEAVGDEYAGTPIWYTIADFKESHNTIAALRLELEAMTSRAVEMQTQRTKLFIELEEAKRKLDASVREWLALTKDKAALESCIESLRRELEKANSARDLAQLGANYWIELFNQAEADRYQWRERAEKAEAKP